MAKPMTDAEIDMIIESRSTTELLDLVIEDRLAHALRRVEVGDRPRAVVAARRELDARCPKRKP